MYLECFCPDPYDAPSWIYDVDQDQTIFALENDGTIVEVRERKLVTVRALPIPMAKLEELAEEMLSRAAALNKPVPANKVKAYLTNKKGLDVDFSCFLFVKGVEVALPHPEFLGKYSSNQSGEANILLYNSRAVVPVLRSKRRVLH